MRRSMRSGDPLLDAVYTLINALNRDMRQSRDPQYQEQVRKQQVRIDKKKEVAIQQISEDAEFRLEVMEAIMATGVARHVAAERTNTELKLLNEARAYGV